MTAEISGSTIVYLADGKIRLKDGSAARTLESPYGNNIREKAIRAQQKHSWKGGADGSSFLSGQVLWGKAAKSQDIPLAVTSICAGREKGGLLYSLESGSLCALLEARQLGTDEKRLWNDNRTRLRHLAVSPATGDIACAVLHENGTANIGLKLFEESGVRELTEGDSFDTAPHWLPGEGSRIVFQSAGVGRNREGHFLGFGPFCIQQLDVASGTMETLLEDPHFDYLAPRGWLDGSLFYIRRPYTLTNNTSFGQTLKDCALFPIRFVVAIFGFLNIFSTIFSGRHLRTDDGNKQQQMHIRQMMIWGNLVQGPRRNRADAEGVDLVPKSWELHCRDAAGHSKVLASGVLAYDVAADGTVVYTNGNALFLLRPDGTRERVLNEAMIEQVFFVPS